MSLVEWNVTMKHLVLALGAISALGVAPAFAQTVVSDTDGNGTYSFEELQAAYPDLKQGTFSDMDVNGDGEIDADELQAARENGTIGA
ncbi:EF hand domain-containing protein [Defluviimonas denitrificans]|uniref:EF hand domain-containing protein n=2 Tax=Albidovulum denitrificans TaxID=404881 RepID=A0A2S8SC85_9RHOB|nr:EF hand domain-containing protein [Defluviimonas denitrificans]